MVIEMSHKKNDREIWQHRFNLSSDNPDDVRLHDRLELLAKDNKAAQWIREALLAKLAPEYNGSTTVVPGSFYEPAKPKNPPVRTNGHQEPRYERSADEA